jgi:hypothetical protein
MLKVPSPGGDTELAGHLVGSSLEPPGQICSAVHAMQKGPANLQGGAGQWRHCRAATVAAEHSEQGYYASGRVIGAANLRLNPSPSCQEIILPATPSHSCTAGYQAGQC